MNPVHARRRIHWKPIMILGLLGLWGGFWSACPSTAEARNHTVSCKVNADRAVLLAGASQKVVLKVTLDAAPPPKRIGRPAVNLAIVLDRSGSMAGAKLEKAKEAAIEALNRLNSKDIFSVVVYNHVVKTIVPAQSAENVEWIKERIRGISSGGNTALFGGVSQGASEVRKHLDDKYVRRIILLSDGIANVGPATPEDLGRLGAALLKEGMSVTTVGVGTDYNEDLMTRLSRQSDGNTYFVESSSDLPRIFSDELGDVLSVVAKNVRVIIECPVGVRPLNIIGREGRIKGRTVELAMNQLYGGQQKYVLLEVDVPERKTGETMELAVARVSYENPFTRTQETSLGQAQARFSSNHLEVSRSVNASVQKDYELNRNALLQEQAIAYADKGKTQQAVEVLNRSAHHLNEAGKKFKNRELLDKAEEMKQQAERIEREGMTRSSRKRLRTDSYQTQQQQMKH